MKDTAYPVRRAFYQLLAGHLSYENTTVPVSDEGQEPTNAHYVILSTQSSTPGYTKTSYDRICSITLDIVTTQDGSATKDIADSIASQIFALLFPTSRAHKHALPTQTGLQFLNITEEADNYLPLQLSSTKHITRRIIQFSLRVCQ